jgi:hypothetical protein
MISPLGQRQIHVASNLEALRAAHEVAEGQQREVGRKQAADDRLAQAQSEVPGIAKAEALRTEERQGRRGGGAHPGSQPEEAEEEAEASETAKANPADRHLDFLA